MKKKNIPLSVLNILAPYMSSELASPFYKIVEDKEALLSFRDIDPESDFHFTIIKSATTPAGQNMITLSIKPKNQNEVKGWFVEDGDPTNIKKRFDDWAKTLEGYAKVRMPDDDPIEKQYEEEAFAEFEIIDEDADTKSYDLASQLRLSQFLDSCKEQIVSVKESSNERDVSEVEKEIDDLKKNQTSLTKRKVQERLAKILAKVRKVSLPLFIQFVDEVKKEIIKITIKAGIEAAKGMIQ